MLHEIDHVVTGCEDASGDTEIGECEDHINAVRIEVDLPIRADYYFTRTDFKADANFTARYVRLSFERNERLERYCRLCLRVPFECNACVDVLIALMKMCSSQGETVWSVESALKAQSVKRLRVAACFVSLNISLARWRIRSRKDVRPIELCRCSKSHLY